EDAHGFGAVFELRFFVLHADDDAGWNMGDADGGVGGVDVLAAVTGGAEDIDLEVVVVDLDIDILSFGKNGDGGGGGVDAALRLGGRDALDAVDAGFVAKVAVGTLA